MRAHASMRHTRFIATGSDSDSRSSFDFIACSTAAAVSFACACAAYPATLAGAHAVTKIASRAARGSPTLQPLRRMRRMSARASTAVGIARRADGKENEKVSRPTRWRYPAYAAFDG
ncbi:hypothetical protein BURMUCGD2M_4775 [Burkholderia multivorans CGD2M]|nr:hypothetical protein BURMUCGD2M_4775 [Burkholderia multivorans CGD2M]